MIKSAVSPMAIQPGQICGFFDKEQFHLGLILTVTDNNCQVSGLHSEALHLPLNRLVLISDAVFPLDNPALNLQSFRQQVESFQTELSLPAIRQMLLQTDNAFSLEDIILTCSLSDADACRFALFLALRARHDWFRIKKGIYRALTAAEEQEFYQEEERKELYRKDLDSCPLLAKKGIPVLFTPALLQEAEEIAAYQSDHNRKDLTGLDCWTIDAESTQDLDDAISLTQKEKGWELGIHISDLSVFFNSESALEQEAFRRVTSAYLPGLDVHMLPESISCDKASLLEGQIRPALSVICNISQNWEIKSYQTFPSEIKISRNFSYDEVDAFLSAENPSTNAQLQDKISILQMITEKHLQSRIDRGAVIWGENDKSEARKIVAECMVIYNRILAELAAEHDLPLYYRFSETLLDIDKERSVRMMIPPSGLGTEPHPHTTMGLKVYARATSPLRRYSDLVNQRQIIAFLNSQKLPYGKEQLDAGLEHIMQTQRRIKQLTLQAEQLSQER